MPSFDSQLSEDVQSTEGDLNGDQRDKVNSFCDISDEMRSLLEKLQSFELSASGDHEVLQQLTLERLKLERKKWSEILRKSLSNVVRIQNTISNAFDKTSSPSSEAACHLIHLDFRDEAMQTEEAPLIVSDLKNQETQTDLNQPNLSFVKDKTEDMSNTGQSQYQSGTKSNSCPNICFRASSAESLPNELTADSYNETLNFDINQLKYCMETDIVDDFVLL